MPYRVLIGHADPEERAHLAGVLEGTDCFEVVSATGDGLTLLREALARRPELVLMDLSLETADGLEVLERLRQSGFAGRRMVLSAAADLLDRACELGADACLRIPCRPRVLADRACELVSAVRPGFCMEEVVQVTRSFWPELDLFRHYKGAEAVEFGVYILLRDSRLLTSRKATREFYPMIGAYQGGAGGVERNIRTLIDQIWKRNGPEIRRRYFGRLGEPETRPTATAFLGVMTGLVRERLRAQRAQTRERWSQLL